MQELHKNIINTAETWFLEELTSKLSSKTVCSSYQYSNHLGSACLELDASAAIISYEEYHPFGTTSYRSGRNEVDVSLKRYRYVGKERDEETGLYYYGARYYAAWLCRFVSVDPLNEKYPELSAYQYASNRPVTGIDLDGLEFESAAKNVTKAFGIPFDDLSGATNKRVEGFANMSNAPDRLNCYQSCLYIWSTTNNPYVTEYLKELDDKIYYENSKKANMSSPHPTVSEFINNADKYHYFISPEHLDKVEPGDMIVLNPNFGIYGHYAIVVEKPKLIDNTHMEIRLGTTFGDKLLFGETTYNFTFENNKWNRMAEDDYPDLNLVGFLRIEEGLITKNKLGYDQGIPEKMALNKVQSIEYNENNIDVQILQNYEFRDVIPLSPSKK